MLSDLLPDNALKSLAGDGAYDTQPAYDALVRQGTIPIIPPRKNVRIRKGLCLDAAIAACRLLGRSIWKPWIGCLRRSLVETKMNCIQRLGVRVIFRTFTRQVKALHIRAAILNRFIELSRTQRAAVA